MIRIKTKKPIWSSTNRNVRRIVGSNLVLDQSNITNQTFFTKMKIYQLHSTDLDRDGAKNIVDCRPYDPNHQDFGSRAAPYKKSALFKGYKIEDYYYANGKYHLRHGAEKVEKEGFFSRFLK